MPFTGSDICKVRPLFAFHPCARVYSAPSPRSCTYLNSPQSTVLNIPDPPCYSLAILLPPLGVFLERGCNADFLINILLTILGYIPGIIHALYIILKY
ncbi:hypothetical protein C8Q73DRAFT_636197 [Cubamyces lactineus]|nr:hypothetical protein C8Q73DRAFT_636197 [Cubamyces lactineus]